MRDFERIAVWSLTPQRGILIAAQGNALGSSDISEKALKGRTNLQFPGLVARGLKPPCQPPACLQHARNKSASTWGWKPQAIVLRACSTPNPHRSQVHLAKSTSQNVQTPGRAEGTHVESLGFPTLGEGSHRFHACCRHAGWGPGFQPSDTGIWTMGSGVDSPTVYKIFDKGTAKVAPKCPNSR